MAAHTFQLQWYTIAIEMYGRPYNANYNTKYNSNCQNLHLLLFSEAIKVVVGRIQIYFKGN